jgi:hypothetical protein
MPGLAVLRRPGRLKSGCSHGSSWSSHSLNVSAPVAKGAEIGMGLYRHSAWLKIRRMPSWKIAGVVMRLTTKNASLSKSKKKPG